MTLPALPPEGSTAWYAHYTGLHNTAVAVPYRQPYPNVRVGDWLIQPGSTVTDHQPPNGELWAGFMFLPPGTYDTVCFNVSVAGTAGAVAKLVAWNDDNGYAGTLLFETSTVDVTTTGVKQITGLGLVAPSGGKAMWIGSVTQGAPTTLPKFYRISATAQPTTSSAASPPLTFLPSPCFVTTGITGAAPASSGTGKFDGHTRVAFKRSA